MLYVDHSKFICVHLGTSACICVHVRTSVLVCVHLRASAYVHVRLHLHVCSCEPSTVKSNFDSIYLRSNASYRHDIKTIIHPRPLIRHIQESRKASQEYASSERCSFVGGVSETIDRVPTVFLDLEKLPTWDKDWRGGRLKA